MSTEPQLVIMWLSLLLRWPLRHEIITFVLDMFPAKSTKLDANFPACSVRHNTANIWVQTYRNVVVNV